jgi:hypothetical protein
VRTDSFSEFVEEYLRWVGGESQRIAARRDLFGMIFCLQGIPSIQGWALGECIDMSSPRYATRVVCACHKTGLPVVDCPADFSFLTPGDLVPCRLVMTIHRDDVPLFEEEDFDAGSYDCSIASR